MAIVRNTIFCNILQTKNQTNPSNQIFTPLSSYDIVGKHLVNEMIDG